MADNCPSGPARRLCLQVAAQTAGAGVKLATCQTCSAGSESSAMQPVAMKCGGVAGPSNPRLECHTAYRTRLDQVSQSRLLCRSEVLPLSKRWSGHKAARHCCFKASSRRARSMMALYALGSSSKRDSHNCQDCCGCPRALARASRLCSQTRAS